jgi:3,4-dihydroxy 2-butanone 4-phosphate synthase/GTP cyclohydrolase II
MQAVQAAPSGVIVLLNCEETAEQMFDQFKALNAPESRPQARCTHGSAQLRYRRTNSA